MGEIRGYTFPDGLYYLVEHDMWARPESDGMVTVGITALGVQMAGDLYAYMPKPVGTAVERERAFGMVEMSKAISALHSPLSGRLQAINTAAVEVPSVINADPYGAGWLARFVPDDWSEDVRRLASGAGLASALLPYMDAYDIR